MSNPTPQQPRTYLSPPTQVNSQDPTQPPQSDIPPAQQPVPLATTSKKVIQPSAELVQEIKAEQAEQTAAVRSPAQPQGPTSQANPAPDTQPSAATSSQAGNAVPTTPTIAPQPTKPDVNSIYPEATRGINDNAARYPSLSPTADTQEALTEITFSEGYVVGGTIFFYELIGGLVLEFLSSRVDMTFHMPLVLAALYVVDYLILLYLPYHVLRSEVTGEALWLSLIGSATQTVVFAAASLLIAVILHVVGGLGVLLGLVAGIGFIVVSYFLTKLSWGIAFSLARKIKSKLVMKVVGIGLVAVFIGVIAYHFALQRNTRTATPLQSNASSVQSGALSAYHVSGKPPYAVMFYKGARTFVNSGGSGSLTISTGAGVKGVAISIQKAAVQTTQHGCNTTDPSSEFDFNIQGSSGIVCIVTTNNIPNYFGHITVNGVSYDIDMFSFSQRQNLVTVKAIFNSIAIE
jgi:hypothetical protein